MDPVSYDVIVSIMNFCHRYKSSFLSFIVIANTTNHKNVTFHEIWTIISSLIKNYRSRTWLSAEFPLYFMKNYAWNNFQSKTSLARYYFHLTFILIARITNYMYAKFFEVWTIIFKVFAFSGYSGVLFTRRSDFLHLFAGYFFWWNCNHGLKCGHCLY